MSLLSRLFGKPGLAGGTKPPKAATPDAAAGSFTITIDASQHIIQAVTVFRNDTAQVVRTFHDLTLKVRRPPQCESVRRRLRAICSGC